MSDHRGDPIEESQGKTLVTRGRSNPKHMSRAGTRSKLPGKPEHGTTIIIIII